MNLKAEQYWRWRFKIEEMKHAETSLKLSHMHFGQLEKDAEIQRLKMAIFKNTISSRQDTVNLKKKEYEEIKAEIEKDLGMSLNNCTIDDFTYEVRKLED